MKSKPVIYYNSYENISTFFYMLVRGTANLEKIIMIHRNIMFVSKVKLSL